LIFKAEVSKEKDKARERLEAWKRVEERGN